MQSDKEIDELLNGIFEGTINVANLPEDLYLATAKYLEGGLYKGYGAKLDASMYYLPDYELLSELRDNVYIFSGAKTYQQVRDMSGLIAKTKTFSEFQREARKVYDEYNKNWLKAEYQTTIGQGQMANLWNQIEQTKDIFPYLEYKAVIDSKTSEICRPLDGVILKVDDPFWNKYTPLNHFNCRCTVKKLDKYTDKLTTNPSKLKEIEGEVSGQVPDEFKMNVGKDGYVFNPKEHPYFKVAPKDKDLAKNNFGLPIPQPPAPNQAVSKPKPTTYKDPLQAVAAVEKAAKEKVISSKEKDVIFGYSSSAFQRYNEPLRGNKPFLQGYEEKVGILEGALNKLPKFEGTVYRGLKFSPYSDNFQLNYEKMKNQLTEGALFHEPAFMSTSYHKGEWAEGYGHNIEMRIKTKTGVNIQSLAKLQSEKETLINKGSNFKVTSSKVVQEKQFDGKVYERLIVDLEQVYE